MKDKEKFKLTSDKLDKIILLLEELKSMLTIPSSELIIPAPAPAPKTKKEKGKEKEKEKENDI